MRAPLSILLLVLSACGRPAPSSPASSSTSSRIEADPRLASVLGEGLRGVVAIHEGGSETIRCSDVALCTTRTVPASTFKIVSSIIGLETGVAADGSHVIPWDGVTREFPDWNRDHDMQSAFAVSCVPYFQEIARRVGLVRMRESVVRLGYGNAEVGEVVDRFWLDGPLAISPIEQLEFLARLEEGALPISERTRAIVREIMIRQSRGDAVLRGKTGWAAPGTPDELGWFVGYVTRGDRTTYVAVRVTREPDTSDERFAVGRMEAAIRALESVAAY